MSQTFFGWISPNIYECIKHEFNEDDQKRINNTLNYKIQTKLDNDNLIIPIYGINKRTVSVYKEEMKDKKPSFMSVLSESGR